MVNCPELNWIQLSEHSKFGISFIFMEACKLWERHIQTAGGSSSSLILSRIVADFATEGSLESSRRDLQNTHYSNISDV